MSDEAAEAKRFADQLTLLIGEFRHVRPGARGMYLFTALVTMIHTQKGSAPSLKDLAQVCAEMAKRLVNAGLVNDN